MAIFLSVLKIIGLVLLVILGIILFIILYLLFVPFLFRINGDFTEGVKKFSLSGRVSSFLRLFNFNFSWDMDNGFDYKVTLVGSFFKIYPRNTKADSLENIKTEEDRDKNSNNHEELLEIDEDEDDTRDDIQPQKAEIQDNIESHSQNNKKKKSGSSFKNIFNKLKNFNFKETVNSIINKIKKIRETVGDESNRACVKKCISALIKLLKSFKINPSGTDLSFGISDPDVTGKVTAILSMIPIIYSKNTSINPDFNCQDPYIDGMLCIRGRILLVSVVYFILSIYLDKDARRIFDLIGGK